MRWIIEQINKIISYCIILLYPDEKIIQLICCPFPTHVNATCGPTLMGFGSETGFGPLVIRASNRNKNPGKILNMKMPCCLGIAISAKDQNVRRFFCYCHKHGIGWDKEGKANQYIIKDGGIDWIVINISGIISCIIMVIVFIVCSMPSSSSVAPSRSWQGK